MSDAPEGYGLVMPFVTVASTGGPHDDDAYVAGWEAAQLDSVLKDWGPCLHEQYVRSNNVPQIDLIAMHRGYTMVATPWEDAPDEWTHVSLSRPLSPMETPTDSDTGT